MKIAFVHSGHAILPEILAYKRHFQNRGLHCIDLKPGELIHSKADIEWHFMGQHRHRHHPGAIVIHEYASLSAPPLSGWKDQLKKRLNCQPDYRLFLNTYIKEKMDFTDGIPWGYRDMFFQAPLNISATDVPPRYDCIYAGSVHASRKPALLLNHFAWGGMKGHTLLILSTGYEKLQEQYKTCPTIRFAGPVDADRVWEYICQCRFAINFQPNREPFNQQTSSKLLEYAACKVPIVTTRYPWIEAFQKTYGGRYFYLDTNLSNFTWEELVAQSYEFPDLSTWNFQTQLKHSGILEFLYQKTGDSRFTGEV